MNASDFWGNPEAATKTVQELKALNRSVKPYADLDELYARLLGQWSLEMNHVAAIVGGYNSQQKHIGQNGVRFELIPRPRQEAAVKFLNDNAFKAPVWALNENVLRRIEPVGVLDRIEASQTRVLNSLLSSGRVLRLVEQEALDGAAAYAPLDFLSDVRRGVWTEIYAPASSRIDDLQARDSRIVNAVMLVAGVGGDKGRERVESSTRG